MQDNSNTNIKRKKILMLTTGGTIASAPTAGGLAPKGSQEILSYMGINP